jgi:glycosyltransferase involved in cell wall biosynthesis
LERVPVVSSLVNILYGPEHRDDPLVSQWKLACWQLADIATAHFARRFHAVGVDVATVMSRRLRVPPALVDVVPRGRDAGALGVPSEERRMLARQGLGVEGSEVILAVGRHAHQKGFDLLLDAFADVATDRPNAQLLIAGSEGSKTPAIKTQIDVLHLASRVRLLGHRADISNVFLAADLFVLSSRREGSPGALLEAMALGVPSIAHDIPAIREVAGLPPVVRLVQPESPSTLTGEIIHQLDHPENAKQMGMRARDRFLQCYTLETAVNGMLKFYERAAGPQP